MSLYIRTFQKAKNHAKNEKKLVVIFTSSFLPLYMVRFSGGGRLDERPHHAI
nr:MAG TPA: hypothetical protein [Caudoviricetes sp.]